jgi:hypothetical protein
LALLRKLVEYDRQAFLLFEPFRERENDGAMGVVFLPVT